MRCWWPHVLLIMNLLSPGLESEEDPARWKQCDLKRGFRTCYTKYDPLGQLAGRGCSSKEKLYREHCEVHEMDGMIERFCYCSFNLCNTSTPMTSAVSPTTLLILLFLLVDHRTS